MTDTTNGPPEGAAPAAPTRPMPRPPGAAVPRAPRPPKQTGGDLQPEITKARITRRRFAWLGLVSFIGTVALGAVYFFFPRTIREKKTTFKVGFPTDYGFGVSTAYQLFDAGGNYTGDRTIFVSAAALALASFVLSSRSRF